MSPKKSDESSSDVISWAVSFVVHVALLLTLALLGVPAEETRRPIALVIAAPTHEEEISLDSGRGDVSGITPEVGKPDPVLAADSGPDDIRIAEAMEVLPSDAPAPDEQDGFFDDRIALASLGQESGLKGERGATFYGLAATGRKIVFVNDCSASMVGQPFEDLLRELRRTVKNLPPRTEFALIFFNTEAITHPSRTMARATAVAKVNYLQWAHGIEPTGGTDPSAAMEKAFLMKPSAIFLVTDGQFSAHETMSVIERFDPAGKVQIHTISLGTVADTEVLQQIAARNRGHMRVVADGVVDAE